MNQDPFVKDDFYAILGNKIRYFRKEKGIDQESFAQCVSLTRTSIINIEKGRQHPSLHQIWLMAGFLGIPLTDLIPPLDLKTRIDDWKERIENNSEIKNEDQSVLIEFIAATRTSK